MKARIVLLLAALAAVPVALIGLAEATPPVG